MASILVVLKGFLVWITFVAFFGPCSCRTDPMEVLCTGHAGSMPYMAAVFKSEPMTDAIIIPTRVTGGVASVTTDVVRRYMRLYFPRTYEELILKYELLLLRGMDSTFFTNSQLDWMKLAIEDAGLGGLQDRSVMSSQGSYSEPWAGTSASEAFPNDADAVVASKYSRSGMLEVVINEDATLPPVLTPYVELLDGRLGEGGWTMMIPRPGSQTFAWARSPAYSDVSFPSSGTFPHTLGWRYGKGYAWSLMDYSASGYWGSGTNPYGIDAFFGLLMYATGRDLPGDVVLVHNLRNRFHEYGSAKSFVLSIMEFADKFGANTVPLEGKISAIDERWEDSRAMYLGQEYQAAYTHLDQVLVDVNLLRSEALKLKDRALLWIYVVEWLAVSGTFLAATFVLWSLMVRRHLYREVGRTALGSI